MDSVAICSSAPILINTKLNDQIFSACFEGRPAQNYKQMAVFSCHKPQIEQFQTMFEYILLIDLESVLKHTNQRPEHYQR